MSSIDELINKDEDKFSRICRITPEICRHIDPFSTPGYSITLMELHWITNAAQQKTPHSHDFFEIHIPHKGSAKIFADNKTVHFKKGSFSITRPGEEHSWEPGQAPIALLLMWILIEPRMVQPVQENSGPDIVKNFFYADSPVFTLPDFFFPAFDALIDEFMSIHAPDSQVIMNNLFQILILQLAGTVNPAGLMSSIQPKHPVDLKQLTGRMFLSRIDEYMQSNLASIASLEQIAFHFEISARTLTRRYSAAKGRSVWEVLNEFRLDKAKTLLKCSYMSVKEIAEKCGFSDVHYFSNRFKKRYGISPSSFKTRNCEH
jgi:AraC-like DNA-binding protein/mannose-6-phosphate isomerase-like protein (cupin superfamily)